jgi:hypothetical protein
MLVAHHRLNDRDRHQRPSDDAANDSEARTELVCEAQYQHECRPPDRCCLDTCLLGGSKPRYTVRPANSAQEFEPLISRTRLRHIFLSGRLLPRSW